MTGGDAAETPFLDRTHVLVVDDTAVCDLEMPRMDGVALCQALRSETATAAIPILVVSGGHPLFQAARDAGCNAVLAKPCRPAQLLATIRELLSQPLSVVKSGS